MHHISMFLTTYMTRIIHYRAVVIMQVCICLHMSDIIWPTYKPEWIVEIYGPLIHISLTERHIQTLKMYLFIYVLFIICAFAFCEHSH